MDGEGSTRPEQCYWKGAMEAYPVVTTAPSIETVVAAAAAGAPRYTRKVRRVNTNVGRGMEVPLAVVTNGGLVGSRGTPTMVGKTIVKRSLPRPGRKRAESSRGKRLSDAGLRPDKSCRPDASGGSNDGVELARDTER